MSKQINKYYIGIDIGLNGAFSVIDSRNNLIEKIVMPTIQISKSKKDYNYNEIINFLDKYSDDSVIIIEKVQPLPVLGSIQSFHLGRGLGLIIGIVCSLGISHHLVHPKTWQKVMFSDIDSSDTKKASVVIAKRIFPNEDFRLTKRCRLEHNGLTDSVLIAKYGLQKNL